MLNQCAGENSSRGLKKTKVAWMGKREIAEIHNIFIKTGGEN